MAPCGFFLFFIILIFISSHPSKEGISVAPRCRKAEKAPEEVKEAHSRVELLLLTTAFHTEILISVPAALLLIQLPGRLGRHQKMAQALGLLTTM